jgi:hypothetical protein
MLKNRGNSVYKSFCICISLAVMLVLFQNCGKTNFERDGSLAGNGEGYAGLQPVAVSEETVAPGGKIRILAKNGQAPYRFEIISGNGMITQLSETEAEYHAAMKEPSAIQIKVIDKSGKSITHIIHVSAEISGQSAKVSVGFNVQSVPDYNGDGYPDILVSTIDNSETRFSADMERGKIEIYSGQDFTPIRSFEPNPNDDGHFGSTTVVADDYDDDGIPDLLVSVMGLYNQGESAYRLLSSVTGQEIYTVFSDDTAIHYGMQEAILMDDLDADGYRDWVTEDVGFDSHRGKIWARCGRTGRLLYSIEGSRQQALLTGLKKVSDRNGDGIADFVSSEIATKTVTLHDAVTGTAISTFSDGAHNIKHQDEFVDIDSDGVKEDIVSTVHNGNELRFSVMSGSTTGSAGKIHFTIRPAVGSQHFRYRGQTSDLNGDGIPELLASDVHFNSQTGRIYVFSGKDGRLVYTIDGEEEATFFGANIEIVEDLDQDQVKDLVVTSNDIQWRGKVSVYSGIDGNLIFSAQGENENENMDLCKISSQGAFRSKMTTMADIDEDGTKEFLFCSSGDITIGKLSVYSAKGELLGRLEGDSAGDMFASKILYTDSNLDGRREFYISAPLANEGAGNIFITDNLKDILK